MRRDSYSSRLFSSPLPPPATPPTCSRTDAKRSGEGQRDPFALHVAVAPPPEPIAIERTAEVAVAPEVAPPVETFRVTGIIRVGERGCAIVNEKTWYLGKMNLGYELVKLEDERIEIKTPDGRTVTCELIRERAATEGFGAPVAP
jgi:hypothetical protein